MSYYIIIRGPLGCGKSTVSERLAKILKAHYVPIDRILDKHNLTKEKEQGYISQKSFIKANKIIIPKAKDFLDKSKIVIFDGNFYWKSQIEDLIRRLNYPYYVFTLKAPLEVCIERDSKRKKVHGKDAAKAVYKKSTEFEYGKVIDITKPISEVIKDIISSLPRNSN
jgi:adenylate kinase family enzyme